MTGPFPPVTDASPEAATAAIEVHRREQARMFAEVHGGVVVDRPDLFLYVTGQPVGFGNGALNARLEEGDVDGRIEEAVELFRRHRVPATWLVGPLSRPDSLGRRLQAHGLAPDVGQPWMAASIDAMPEPPVPAGLSIERVEGPELEAAFLETMRLGFGSRPEAEEAIAAGVRAVGQDPHGPWVRFVGSIGGRPVGTSGLMPIGGVAGIYNVATVTEARRLGVGAAMTVAAVRHAAERGYRVAILGSSAMGYRLYQRLGFREAFRQTGHVFRL